MQARGRVTRGIRPIALAACAFFSLVAVTAAPILRYSAITPRHVYVDVGGNVGDSVAAFINVGVPGVARPGHLFDAIYVFEPNPEFASRYERYRGRRYAFEFIAAAAAANDGVLSFAGSDLGGSTKATKVNDAVSVKSIDFSAWLARTVSPADFVVCKIDAEGSEYEIVQRMMADGTLCLCDRLSIEWHGWLGTRGEAPGAATNAHVRSFLDASGTTERFDGPACGAECFCSIPHLARELPYFYCGLPYTVKWVRAACGRQVPAGTPALEHHESWKGWDHVGHPDAFERYPNV